MNRRHADFLLKYAVPNEHYTLETAPEAYLRSSAVCYQDLLTVLTSDHYTDNIKVLVVFHPLADIRILEIASKLNIESVNNALLAQEYLPHQILMQLIHNEDHYIRALAVKHRNATTEMIMQASTDPHPFVRKAAKSRDLSL